MTASWTEAKRCCLVMDASKKCPASSWATTGAVSEKQVSLDSKEPPGTLGPTRQQSSLTHVTPNSTPEATASPPITLDSCPLPLRRPLTSSFRNRPFPYGAQQNPTLFPNHSCCPRPTHCGRQPCTPPPQSPGSHGKSATEKGARFRGWFRGEAQRAWGQKVQRALILPQHLPRGAPTPLHSSGS